MVFSRLDVNNQQTYVNGGMVGNLFSCRSEIPFWERNLEKKQRKQRKFTVSEDLSTQNIKNQTATAEYRTHFAEPKSFSKS